MREKIVHVTLLTESRYVLQVTDRVFSRGKNEDPRERKLVKL